MRNILLTLTLILIQTVCLSQTIVCGADEYNQKFIDDNPTKYKQIEQNMQNWIVNSRLKKDVTQQQYMIPVVFHIVWNDSVENLHDSIIHRQLEVINRDFNLLNTDTSILTDTLKFLPGNMGITFELATVNPKGGVTTGITRTNTTVPAFSYWDNAIKFDDLGGKDAWDPVHYMNIWVGDLGGGLLGYSQFPGGDTITDGNVIDYAVTGNAYYPWTYGPDYAGGRVLVHEIGHWLNLFHPWWGGGLSWCGDDGVYDTGKQDGPTYPQAGCPDTSFSNCTPSEREIVKIYMDYCGDSCMVAFTNGQVERAHASIQTYRQDMINQFPVGVTEESIQEQLDIKIYPTITRGRINIDFPKDIQITGKTKIHVYDMMGKLVEVEHMHGEKSKQLYLYKLSNGTYHIQLINNGYTIHSQKIIISKDSPYGTESLEWELEDKQDTIKIEK
jgi:hypothetical protein